MDQKHLLEQLIGVATFDLSGLPKEYFIKVDSALGINWLQPVFQVIGMRSLLSASLALENFRYAMVEGSEWHTIILRQQSDYLALLLDGQAHIAGWNQEELLNWSKAVDMGYFRNNPQYKAV